MYQPTESAQLYIFYSSVTTLTSNKDVSIENSDTAITLTSNHWCYRCPLVCNRGVVLAIKDIVVIRRPFACERNEYDILMF